MQEELEPGPVSAGQALGSAEPAASPILEVRLGTEQGIPVYQQLADQIRLLALAGQLAAEERCVSVCRSGVAEASRSLLAAIDEIVATDRQMKGEYYLTDAIQVMIDDGARIEAATMNGRADATPTYLEIDKP